MCLVGVEIGFFLIGSYIDRLECDSQVSPRDNHSPKRDVCMVSTCRDESIDVKYLIEAAPNSKTKMFSSRPSVVFVQSIEGRC